MKRLLVQDSMCLKSLDGIMWTLRCVCVWRYIYMCVCVWPFILTLLQFPANTTNRAAGAWVAAVYFQPELIFPAGGISVNNKEKPLSVPPTQTGALEHFCVPKTPLTLWLQGTKRSTADVRRIYRFILDDAYSLVTAPLCWWIYRCRHLS